MTILSGTRIPPTPARKLPMLTLPEKSRRTITRMPAAKSNMQAVKLKRKTPTVKLNRRPTIKLTRRMSTININTRR